VATCTQDRRPWIWIYPWISTQKSVDMDMDMDGKFHIHGKPGRYTISVCNQPVQPPWTTQPSIPLGYVYQVPAFVAAVRWGVFTCVGWQVTVCDLIW